MRKCPRCGSEINDDEKFCPRCGLDIQQHYGRRGPKNKSMTYLLYVIIFFSFVTIPLLYSRLLGSFDTGLNSTQQTEKIELKEVKEVAPTAIAAQYTTLADYDKQFTNVSSYVKNIEEYENNLTHDGKYVLDKEYIIQVLDNFNVLYRFRYTVKVNDNFTVMIEKQFDRGHSYNKEKVVVKKNNVEVFTDFVFNEEEMGYTSDFIEDQIIVKQLMNDFSSRGEEFEAKKEKLGHYGIGNYDGLSSFVAHRKGKTYYSELTYSQDVKEFID